MKFGALLIMIIIIIYFVEFIWKHILKRVWYEISIRAFDRTAKRIVKFNQKILKEKNYT